MKQGGNKKSRRGLKGRVVTVTNHAGWPAMQAGPPIRLRRLSMPPRHHLMLALCLNLVFVLGAPAAPEETAGAENPTATTKAHVPMAKIFADADTDKNNAVTLAEIRAVSPEFSEARFKKMDKNANGLLERRETVRKPKATPPSKSQENSA